MNRVTQLASAALFMLLAAAAAAGACPATAGEVSLDSSLPPPPVSVTIRGELINMTDFAPPDSSSWKLQRADNQVSLDISQVRGRVKKLWNSRVKVEGFWRGAAGSPDRVFVVTSIRRD